MTGDSPTRYRVLTRLQASLIIGTILAVIQTLPLAAFSAFMLWYCRRVIETRSLPPTGAWIIEGQRIRTGAGAARNARILLALTGLVTVIGAFAAVYADYIALSPQRHSTGS